MCTRPFASTSSTRNPSAPNAAVDLGRAVLSWPTVWMVLALAIWVPNQPAHAAEAKPSTLVQLSRHAKAKLRVIEVYVGRGNMDGADAIRGYTIIDSGLLVPYAKWGELDLSARYDVRSYDFDGRSDLVDGIEGTGTPFSALHRYVTRLGTNIRVADNLYWSMGAFSQAKIETGANLHDATRFGGFAAVGVQIAPRLFVGLGVGTKKKLTGGPAEFTPIGRVHLQLTEKLDLQIKNKSGRLRLKINKKFRVHLNSAQSDRVYRLRNRGADAASKITESNVPIYLRFYWNSTRRTQFEFTAGVLLNHKLKTNAGETKQTIDQGTAAYFGVGVRFRN